jgi:hypothetical protein
LEILDEQNWVFARQKMAIGVGLQAHIWLMVGCKSNHLVLVTSYGLRTPIGRSEIITHRRGTGVVMEIRGEWAESLQIKRVDAISASAGT